MSIDSEIERLQLDFVELFKKDQPTEIFMNLLNNLPFVVAFLSMDRKVIFANTALLSKYGFSSVEQVLGKKPGEIISCLHAKNDNQCGLSQNCKVCGALAAIKKTQSSKMPAASEMHLTSVDEGTLVSHDLRVTVTPLVLSENKMFLMLYLEDISNEKRRKAIERIFFHDILNKVSMLNGLYELMLKSDSTYNKEHLDLLGLILEDLTHEIASQRQLAAAENGELIAKMESILLHPLLQQIIRQAAQLAEIKNIKIELKSLNSEIEIVSNSTLLNRIVTNLIKNAIEASGNQDIVTVELQMKSQMVLICVHNKAFMDEDIQLQVFMRSFSTKGENRGLGTYSVKLLTERYLGGKVWFDSNAQDGTTFFVELPYQNPGYVI